MNALHWLGSAGIGLVWGWLVAQVLFPARPRDAARLAFRTLFLRSLLPGLLSTALLGWTLWAFAGVRGLIVFLSTAVLAFVIRFAWQRSLRDEVDLADRLSRRS